MKKGILLFLSMTLCFGLAACAEREATPPVTEQSPQQEQTHTQDNALENQATNEPGSSSDITPQTPETAERKAKLTINGQEFDVTLYDTPAADALYNMLPLTLTFEDFNNTEKIAYMDNELPTDGEPNEFDPDIGDLCLYAPWGNLSIFYKDFRNSTGLISLGHIDSGIDIIGNLSDAFTATLEARE